MQNSADNYNALRQTTVSNEFITSTPTNTITTYISIASLKNNALFSRTNTSVKHSCFPQQNEYRQEAGSHTGGPHLPDISPCTCTSETIPSKPATTLICQLFLTQSNTVNENLMLVYEREKRALVQTSSQHDLWQQFLLANIMKKSAHN